ncbi:DNA-directed RNA polymerase II subunit rpb1-like [Scylla paramamosain]|uniref:DNA-directed RNA polymerase II subunit rpb1-like n=1 Tax=Scylla paramamosain TaxID=85552 RepID=UPI003082971C
MEVDSWQEQQVEEQGGRQDTGKAREGNVMDGRERIYKRTQQKQMEGARLRRKHRAIAAKNQEEIMTKKNGNQEEGRREMDLCSTSEGDAAEGSQNNMSHEGGEEQQGDTGKIKKSRGKKKPRPPPSETNMGRKLGQNNERCKKKKKHSKRPRLEEDAEGDFEEFSRRERLESKKEGMEKKSQEEMQDVEKQFEMCPESRYKCILDPKEPWPRCSSAEVSPAIGKQVPTVTGTPSDMTNQLDAKLPRKVSDDEVGSASKCDSETGEEKLIDSSQTCSDGEGVCTGSPEDHSGPATSHPRRRIPTTVSIWALPVEEPSSVKLTAVKPQDIVSSSLMEVTVAGLRGEYGSVTDPRLGHMQVDSATKCFTCDSPDCLGHSGYIDLREYVFQPAFMTRCVQTLRRLCYHCLGPAVLCQRNFNRMRKALAAQRRQSRLTKMWQQLHGRASEPVQKFNPHLCTKKQPKYRVVVREGVKTVEVVLVGKEQRAVELSASTIRAIFAEVSKQTWQFLGMRDPSDEVFIRYLRVCPASFRTGTMVEDRLAPSRLTVLYNNVVTLRNQLDVTAQQIKKVMAGQDEVVRSGVHMLLSNLIDALISPGQHPDAPAAILDKERGAAGAGEEYIKEGNVACEKANSTSNGPCKYEVSILDALPECVNFTGDALTDMAITSEGEMEGAKKKSSEPYSLDSGGSVEDSKTNKAVAFSNPPTVCEWLLPSDDDHETDSAEREEQKVMCQKTTCKEKDNSKEKMEYGDRARREERLRLTRHQVQEVAAKVSTLHQRARKQLLALTAAVAAIVQEQMSRISGKQGVVRHHLLGKRINKCARAVFTGDNSLPLGVVGVPRTIAAKLLQYVHVHQSNLKECEEMVRRFPEYPCVVSVIRGERRYDVNTLRDKMAKLGDLGWCSFRLQTGDVVQRHLMDGDQVVVNRQPTLAKTNMQTHAVRVTDSRTISLNISITDNYAADCDGDEMNLFVPGVKSHSSRMLDVSHNVIFFKNGKVSLKIKQDALRGAYTASLRDTFFTLEEFRALAPSSSHLPPPALLKPHRLWTGLQLLSLALPVSLTVDQVGVGMQLDTLVVRHGHMLSGVFDKGGQDKILECCKMFLSHDVILATVKDLQGIAERFVDEVGGTGFSFLPEDWSCPADTLDAMRQELQDVLSRAQNITCPRRRNAKLRQLLANQANRLVPQLTKDSSAAAMLKAGSKKRPQKLAQVCLAVGQHNENDQLPARHLDGRRVLPFFSRDDTRPQAEGFVDQPLFGVGSITADALSGMVARSSSYKKHCATGESGYLQRKLGKMMEDLTVRHDGTVRDANDEIVQLLYGDDGLLPECCVAVMLQTEPLPNHVADFYQGLIGDQSLTALEQLLLKEELQSLLADQQCLRKETKDNHVEISVPFSLPHLMAHVLATVPASGPPPSIIDVVKGRSKFFALVEDSIEKVLRDELPGPPFPCVNGDILPDVDVSRELERAARSSEQRLVRDPLDLLKRYVRQHVNTFIIRKATFSKQQFCALLETMTEMYQESRPAAGECVGALAAQALAEPLMQMTLNACHRAAVASDGDAIPRLTELLNGHAEDTLLEIQQGGLLHARQYLVQEISQVYSLSGESVDARHVRLVVDYMLKEGVLSGFTRHHISPQVSFLKAAAFEQPLSLLQRAGVRARSDDLRGVSENLIFDKAVTVGPHACSAMVWVDLLRDVCPTTPPRHPPPRPRTHQDDEPSYEFSSPLEAVSD